MIHRFVAGSRFLIILAVIGCAVLATVLLFYGLWQCWELVAGVFEGAYAGKGGKKLLLACIETVDIFLLATVLYITGLGLYELFVDDTIPVPVWLKIRSLDDLKDKLIGVVVTVLGVLFLGQVVTWDGQQEILGYGVAIGTVIAALTFFSKQVKSTPKERI